jgi:GTP-binding protein EngB required for normal cell division
MSAPVSPDTARIDPADSGKMAKDYASVSKKIAVGEALRTAHETISAAGRSLVNLSDRTTAEYIRRILAMTEMQLCQIAFIGQMNAGKSSLINALIGAPEFLPTEITPWTTVVTNLYFGVPNKPAGGADFEFFKEEEWRQLAEGGGRVRSLTERNIPNFPWESFHKQVNDMRNSAEKKLGPRYLELLGKQHSFEIVTPGLLERYIAAESPLDDDDTATAGEYSIITKAAHIYSDLTSFLYPTVIIDTPGINDPYLIRDEITRQNLERGNIFVIVVTARQPLSNADLDLLRILRGLRKENIIIFINKIDEIDDFDNHVPAIVERTRTLLKREFPDRNIPILTGSAHWAEVALSEDADELHELTGANDSPLSSPSLAVNGSKSFWLSDPSAEQTVMAEAILARSAIPDLGLAISDMLRTGPVAANLRYASSALLALAKNGLTRTETNAKLVRALLAHRDGDPSAAAKIADEHQAKLNEASAVRQLIDETIDQAQADYATIIAETVNKLIDTLKAQLQRDLAASEDQTAATGDAGSGPVRLPIISRLRSRIETELSDQFQGALSRINAVVHDAEQSLRDKVGRAAATLDMRIEYPCLPALNCSPSLAALSDPIATEVGGAAFSSSWTRRLSSAEQDELKSVIESQFKAIIEKLSQSAGEELEKTTQFIMEHFRFHASHSLKLAIDQKQAVISEYRGGVAPGSQPTEGSASGRPAIQLNQMERGADDYKGIAADLITISIDENR